MVAKAQKSHGTRSELNSVFGLEKVDRWNPIRTTAIQSKSVGTSSFEFEIISLSNRISCITRRRVMHYHEMRINNSNK
jgi:hypothetical protein